MNKIEEIFKAFSIAFDPNAEQAELASKRIEICDACEFKNIINISFVNVAICTVCGCMLKAKIFTPVLHNDDDGVKSCPKSFWDNIENQYFLEKENKKNNI